jgi:hypothetical protein
MQVLTQATLAHISSRTAADGTAAEALAALSALADLVPHAPDAAALSVLQTIATLLIQILGDPASAHRDDQRANSSTASAPAPRLDAGYPFLALFLRAPHLTQAMLEPLTAIFAAATHPTMPLPDARRLLHHLRPALLAALSTSAPLGTEVVSMLQRAAAARAELQPVAYGVLVTQLRLVATCPPTPLPPAMPSIVWALADEFIAQAISESGINEHDGKGPAAVTLQVVQDMLQLLLHVAARMEATAWLAAPLHALMASSAAPAFAGTVAAAAAGAAAAQPFSSVEPVLLQVVCIAARSTRDAVQFTPALRLLAPQLLQHSSVPANGKLHALATNLLSLCGSGDVAGTCDGGAARQSRAACAAGVALTDHSSTVLRMLFSAQARDRTCAWLANLEAAAVASLLPQQRARCNAATHALRCGTCWPAAVDAALLADATSNSGKQNGTAAKPAEGQPCFHVQNDVVALLANIADGADGKLRNSAAATWAAVALADPSSVASLVPWALNAINKAVTPDGEHDATVLMPLALFPLVCASPFLEQLFFAVAAQLLDTAASPRVQALGVRLLLTYWQATGRGWTVLSQAIAASGPARGRAAHNVQQDVIVRRAAATAVAAVSRAAPERCLQAIAAVGGMLEDEDSMIAAMALEAIFWMCYYVRLPFFLCNVQQLVVCEHGATLRRLMCG